MTDDIDDEPTPEEKRAMQRLKKLLQDKPFGGSVSDAKLFEPCCANERRSLRGGCLNCGDPCI